MFDAQEIKKLIGQGLPGSFVEVASNDGVHFSGIVVSDSFVGKPKVRQHQAVYATLGKLMDNEIHALQLQTYTPEQWEKVRQDTEG